MNFIAQETSQKLRGGFYTESAIAEFLVRWVKQGRPQSILEPSCGDGAFLAAIQAAGIRGLNSVTACELDAEEAAKASGRAGKGVTVLNTDFLRWYLIRRHELSFDAVVGNPPFIRYQYLPKEQQALAESIFSELDLPFTKHTNAWVPFVLAAIRMLKPGGRLAMVIPSELFHIPHAQSLRSYLTRQCSHVFIIDPEEIWFDGTLQGTVLVLAQKKLAPKGKSHGVAVLQASDRRVLNDDPEHLFSSASYTNGATIDGKWMAVFLSAKERRLLQQCRELNGVHPFVEVASVDVGIVTGANKFFLVPDSIVEEFDLSAWAHPMYGRSDHVRGLIYSPKDHEENRHSGLPANFLWFEEENWEKLPQNLRLYLETGLHQKLHTRFKCRTRRVWYKVPSVYAAPVGMLKRAHHFPRLVLNKAGAYTTDTAYRIAPASGMDSEALVFGFLNSLTSLTAEMEGRHYGGGVLELVPSEIERLLVPRVKTSQTTLAASDRAFRACADEPDFLQWHDSLILEKLGLSKKDCDTLHNAWRRLRDRRQRVPSGKADED